MVKYEEDPADDQDEDFQNKIVLGKKYKSEDEPKLMNMSVEALIEKFCQQNPYLSGRAHELSLYSNMIGGLQTEIDRGLVIG